VRNDGEPRDGGRKQGRQEQAEETRHSVRGSITREMWEPVARELTCDVTTWQQAERMMSRRSEDATAMMALGVEASKPDDKVSALILRVVISLCREQPLGGEAVARFYIALLKDEYVGAPPTITTTQYHSLRTARYHANE